MEYIKSVFNAIDESVFIENIELSSNENYKVVLKTKIYLDDDNSYNDNCDNWVRKYSEHTKTN
jgi:hypothetical protein